MALLFLAQDQIPTEPIWTAFLAAAAEVRRKQRVPPTQPDPATMLPPIQSDPEELNSQCWKHGGPFNTFSPNPPRNPFKGAPHSHYRHTTTHTQKSAQPRMLCCIPRHPSTPDVHQPRIASMLRPESPHSPIPPPCPRHLCCGELAHARADTARADDSAALACRPGAAPDI